jgi:hypothetical protein
MWLQVEQDLTRLLSAKPFPALRGVRGLHGVPDYDTLLKPNGQPDPAVCKAAAHAILNSTDLKNGIREFGRRELPKVQEWVKRPICRAVSAKNNPNGAWWFDEELVQRWARQYPPGTANRKQKILDSIRPMLAVCFDWNDFTDLRVMRPTTAIPVITGQGAHKPVHSPSAPAHATTSNVFFIGGFTQVFVPYVNPGLTALYSF